DLINVANTTKPMMDAAKTELDKAAPLATGASNKATALEVAVAAETVAAKAIADAVAKSPQNSELVSLFKKKADALAALNAELTAAKKPATDSAVALKAATDKHAALAKTYSDPTAKVAESQKLITALTPMVKPAVDAVAAAKVALDAANAAIAPAKAAVNT